jgi:hypothetical protein
MNLLYGFRDTSSIIAMKWNSIKKLHIQIIIVAALAFFAALLYGMANIGSVLLLVVNLDLGNQSELIKNFAAEYLNSFASGELNVYVSGVFGATILTILILPFSGYSLGGIVPTRDMAIIKPSNNYRLSDSILVQFVSALSLLQLISLTILSSLLSIEGGTGPAVVFAWATWIVIVFMTVAFMWIIEYFNRKYGNKVKIAMVASVFVILGTAVIIDPFHGTTFFGLSPVYVDVLQNIYTYSVGNQVLSYGILAALLVIFSLVVNFVGTKALMLPEPVAMKDTKKKKVKLSVLNYSSISLFALINLIVFRYKVIWRPILITTVFSAGLLITLGTSGIDGTLSSVMIIIPLVICLSFGINMFGILGSSNIWLASMPNWRETIVLKLAAVQLLVIGTAYLIVIGAGVISQKLSFADIFVALPGIISVSLVMVTYSISKSLKAPVKYTASSRGDAILPPMTLLSYMIKFMLMGGIIGTISIWGAGVTQWIVLAAIVIAIVIWFVKLMKNWLTEETYINNIIKETTSD